MKSTQQGFTLMELIFIVAIIGILVAIAIPSYCDYIGRAKVAEGFTALKKVKLYLVDLAKAGKPLPDKNDAALLSMVDDASIESISWYPEQASLLVAFGSNVTSVTKKKGKYLVFTLNTRDEKIDWECRNQHFLIVKKPIDNRDLPPSCRT